MCMVINRPTPIEETDPELASLLEWFVQQPKGFRAKINTEIVEKTIGRNDPCVCGSGKKYKKCCIGAWLFI